MTQFVFASGFKVESGDAVVISDPVDGTLMTAGQNIVIEGDVNGTLFVAGETITVKGDVNGSIFIAGNTLSIDGNSEGEVFAAGNIIQVSENAELARDVFAAGNQFILNGTVGRDLFVGSNSTQIHNEIGRDARIGTNTLTFSDSGQINGDLYYQASDEIPNIEQRVNGEVRYTQSGNRMIQRENTSRNYLFSFLRIIGSIISALLIWLFLKRLSQNRWIFLSPHVLHRPILTLLIGLGMFLLTFILIILGLVTVVFSNIAILLALVFAAIIFLAKIITASVISKYFISERLSFGKNELIHFLIAYILLYVTSMLPFVGWIITLLCIFYSVGLATQETMARL